MADQAVALQPRILHGLREQIKTAGVAIMAFVVTLLERHFVRGVKREGPRASSVAIPVVDVGELSDLAFVMLGLLGLAPQDVDELATQLGLDVVEVDRMLSELETRGYVRRNVLIVDA